jgi:hypothetical protein
VTESRSRLDDRLVEKALTLAGVVEHRSRFADVPALRIGNRELLHFDQPGLVDLRLTRKLIRVNRELLASHSSTRFRVESSDWVNFELESDSDVEFVVSMLRMAIEADGR